MRPKDELFDCKRKLLLVDISRGGQRRLHFRETGHARCDCKRASAGQVEKKKCFPFLYVIDEHNRRASSSA